jgi:peptidoglycan-N-acetylglucosamine deacetylase
MVLFSIITVIFLVFTAWASFSICSGVFVKAVCRNGNLKKSVLITFDDGPDPVNTLLILDILEKNNVRAVFFMTGIRMEKHPDIVKKMSEKGHLIGNHTFSHSNFFPFYSREKIVSELRKNALLIEKMTGKRTVYFRPPFGVTNPSIAYAVRKMDIITIGWSVRSFDTFLKEKEKILSSVVKKVKGGDIVLFHDTVKGTVEMLDEFIVYCKREGFEFTTPEKFLLED